VLYSVYCGRAMHCIIAAALRLQYDEVQV
jgi:hypothetical protein